MMPGSENPHMERQIPGSAGLAWLLALWLCIDVFASREASDHPRPFPIPFSPASSFLLLYVG